MEDKRQEAAGLGRSPHFEAFRRGLRRDNHRLFCPPLETNDALIYSDIIAWSPGSKRCSLY